jgi:Fic family protein
MFSKLLKSKRSQLKLSISEVAKALEIDPSLYSRIESNQRKATISQIAILSEVLKVEHQWLRKQWLADQIFDKFSGLDMGEDAEDVFDIVSERIERYRPDPSRPPKQSVLIQKKIKELDLLKAKIDAVRPLNKTQMQKLREHFNTIYTYDSNKIEGNTLSLHETALVISKGITVGGKSMREHIEAINHAEAIDYIYDLIQDNDIISQRNIKDIHSLVLRGIDKENAGRYRRCEVMITGSRHIPIEHFMLTSAMEKLIQFYDDFKGHIHPVILAADMHYRLAGIHPFIDGNGRTSRLVMNLILIKHGYILASIKGELKNRLEYYQALEEAQVDKKPEKFYLLILNYTIESFKEYLKFL